MCLSCKHWYYNPIKDEKAKPHRCRIKTCPICQQPRAQFDPDGVDASQGAQLDQTVEKTEHVCYMRTLPKKPVKAINSLYFIDFETAQSNSLHEPVYVCAISALGKEWVSEGPDCAKKFLHHFRNPRYKNARFISHYGKGFDHHIILREYVLQGVAPFIVTVGSKILFMQDPDFGLSFIDSHNFLPMPLRAVSENMGVDEIRKGWFPHHFTSMDNFNFKGPYPDPSFYGFDQMSVKDREEVRW